MPFASIHQFLISTAAASVAVLPAYAVNAQDTPTPQAQPAPETEEEGKDIVVQATRSGRRVQDEPIRVEVIDREEIEEKILMAQRADIYSCIVRNTWNWI